MGPSSTQFRALIMAIPNTAGVLPIKPAITDIALEEYSKAVDGQLSDRLYSLVGSESYEAFSSVWKFANQWRFPQLLIGTNQDDTLNGKANQGNLIFGLDGNDTLRGRAKDDFLFGGDGDDELSGGGGRDRLYGGEGRNTLSGGGGNDRIDNRLGSGRINGDGGNDLILVGTPGNDINGDGGFDTVDYRSLGKGRSIAVEGIPVRDNYIVDQGAPSVDRLQNMEKIIAPGGKGSRFILARANTDIPDSPPDATINLQSGQVTFANKAGDRLRSRSLQLRNFFSATGSNNTDKIIGNNAANILSSGGGADRILGKGGNDILVGGVLTGGATMTGGAGRDQFLIPAAYRLERGARQSTEVEPYTITDFSKGEKILVVADRFNVQEGPLSAEQFGMGREFQTPEQRFAYDPKTGELFYDINGSDPVIPMATSLGTSTKIATLKGAPTLRASSIVAIASDTPLLSDVAVLPQSV